MIKQVRTMGLIVNPIAGIGGRVGLKGSDGAETQRRALALGARPEAADRTVEALKALKLLEGTLRIITCAGAMGEEECRRAGLCPAVILQFGTGAQSGPQDTLKAAQQMKEQGAEIILFAGGDGTARDIFQGMGSAGPAVIGIPAGVKIHSGVFALNPRSAGAAACRFLNAPPAPLREAEVMDLDEEAYRRGEVRPRLYGYLSVPGNERRVQHVKVRSKSEDAQLQGIAAQVISEMEEGVFYFIGAGSTTRRVMECLEIPNTLIGIDVIQNRKLIASDATEQQLWEFACSGKCCIVLTVIGGQGHLFGRGNQQISPRIIRQLGMESIRIVAAKAKLLSLAGHRLLADTGDPLLDSELEGYYRIAVGAGEEVVCKLSAQFSDDE